MVSGRRTLMISGLFTPLPSCVSITIQRVFLCLTDRCLPRNECCIIFAIRKCLFTTFDEATVGARVPSVIYRKLCCSADLLAPTKTCRTCFDVERYPGTKALAIPAAGGCDGASKRAAANCLGRLENAQFTSLPHHCNAICVPRRWAPSTPLVPDFPPLN